MRFMTFLAAVAVAVAGTLARAAPATRPTPEVAGRVARLRANVKSFQLRLSYHGEQDKPYYGLLLSVKPVAGGGGESPFRPAVGIGAEQAEKIISYWTDEGFFDRAIDAGNKKLPPPATPSYTMIVAYDDEAGRHELYDVLGWGPPVLRRLDGLRAVLGGEAAGAMDLLLGRLAGHRREWEKAAATQPAAVAPSGADADGKTATAGTRESLKGWELYVWQDKGETSCSLLTGTNRNKTPDEVSQAAVGGVDRVKAKLGELQAGQYVTITGRKAGDEPPEAAAREIADYCKTIGLRAQ